jgi:50S ribosomal subunit-associated GTPase HflX
MHIYAASIVRIVDALRTSKRRNRDAWTRGEIETDRRIVRDRIALLKDKIKAIDKQMGTQRGNRGAMVRVALVGYTNVGNRH